MCTYVPVCVLVYVHVHFLVGWGSGETGERATTLVMSSHWNTSTQHTHTHAHTHTLYVHTHSPVCVWLVGLAVLLCHHPMSLYDEYGSMGVTTLGHIKSSSCHTHQGAL